MNTPLGGFFGLELPMPGREAGHVSLSQLWGTHDSPFGWSAATSALAALVAMLRPGTVWMPGYICAELLAAVPFPSRRYFPLSDLFEPDITALERRIRPGDLVLAVNMFGRTPGAAWHAFASGHPDVTFVEDCAQSLHTGLAPWGDWQLYSPRKLLGVPEGGILVAKSARAKAQAADLPLPAPPCRDDLQASFEQLAPALARFEAPFENAIWHPMHQAAEAAQTVSTRAISKLARRLLELHDPGPLIDARQRNFRFLSQRLQSHVVLLETNPTFAPFGFPVILPPDTRDVVLGKLYARDIFPAVHWRDIPAPPEFTADHVRAASIVTLPCDHRYGIDDMDRLAVAFLDARN